MLYLPEKNDAAFYAYRCLTSTEFTALKGHQFKSFPPRFFLGKEFILLTSLDAILCRVQYSITHKRNGKQDDVYVIRILLNRKLIEKYIQGSKVLISNTINTEQLEELNKALIGSLELIEVIDLSIL